MEPYTLIAMYPDTGVRTIEVRGMHYDVQSLTPITEEAWAIRLQEAADAVAAKEGF